MGIDEELYLKHVEEAPFLIGEADGSWGIIKGESKGPTWPNALFWVSARAIVGSPDRYFFKIELTNYNQVAPRGCFWEFEKDQPLETKDRPKVIGIHAQAFRTDWKSGLEIYAPWDRSGLEAHPDWRQIHASISWKNGTDRIEDYLYRMWRILNSEQYHGKIGG
jgi:hypothetical protein